MSEGGEFPGAEKQVPLAPGTPEGSTEGKVTEGQVRAAIRPRGGLGRTGEP